MDEILLKPIGVVSNDIREKMRHGWSRVESTITIEHELSSSLDGLEDFSHITVLFWMHQTKGQTPQKVHPQGREDLPLVGVLATRAPNRPNSIGITVAELIERNGNVLKVRGLDAIDGTPVLDIKPYLPKDFIPDTRYPDWVEKLDRS